MYSTSTAGEMISSWEFYKSPQNVKNIHNESRYNTLKRESFFRTCRT